MKKGLILIDANNIGYAAVAAARRQGQKRLVVGEKETGGIYNFLRSIQLIASKAPILTPICLWDGASWRKKAFAAYKAGRDAKPETKAQQEVADTRAAFRAARPDMEKAMRLLGVKQMKALNYEADDLAGMLVERYAPKGKTILLYTGDYDWVQLIGPKVAWFSLVKNLRISPKNLKEQCGVDTPRQWLDVKALHGDTSDEIPGVGGIGEKGAVELVNTFGSVAEFLNRTIDGTLPKLPKKFADFAESNEKQDIYRRNLMLMDLRSSLTPKPVNLTVDPGAFDAAGFEEFCRELMFQSILTSDDWTEPFQPESMKEAA